jgi:Tol biopolymer transport system component
MWLPSADECTSILAWDISHERIACDARGTPPNGEVRIFDLAGTGVVPQLSSTAIKSLNGYQQGAVSEHRRSFSPAGKWLAFATDTALQIGDVQGQPQVQQTVALPPGSSATSPSELVFSPDETKLLWQVDGDLGVIQVQKNGNVDWYGGDLPLLSPAVCNEEFTSGPGKWCGRQQNLGAPAWSPDSQFAAAKTAAHGVKVYDLHDFILGSVVPIDACVSDCPGDFVFQPSAALSQPP